MARLSGKAVNDVIVEYYGPIHGRNYNTAGDAAPPPASIHVRVHGTGQIQLQETQSFILKGNDGTHNFTHDQLPDQLTWVNLGAPVDTSSGVVTVNPTIDPTFSSIRAIIVTPGDGHVVIQSDWR